MGWTVLYIAFGIVALWLLGEVLLQYKARLRWRLLAFVGFLGVVVGVLMPSVVVIAVGAVAFAVGQTYVTLSFRRGFAEGWAVRRRGAAGRKRRGGDPDHQDPGPEDSGPETAEPDRQGDAGYAPDDEQGQDGGYGPEGGYGQEAAGYHQDSGYHQDGGYGHQDGGYGQETGYHQDGVPHGHEGDQDRDGVFAAAHVTESTAAETTTVYEPQPLPEDTGSYGIYGDSYATAAQHQEPGYATAAHGTDQGYSYDYSGYGQQQYGYDANAQQQYANYSDPYIGAQGYGDGSYAPGYGGQQYDQQAYGQEQYGTGGYSETPPGGVWVPQQRTDETYGGGLPPEQPYPHQGNGQQQTGNGYDEQHYRY
jgi:hypothetical protein